MHKRRFSFSERLAIWEAYGRVCLYCEEPIVFRDLEIDHILPEDLQGKLSELKVWKQRLNLGEDYPINDFPNWAASHHGCNKKKGNRISPRLLFFIETAESKARKARQFWQQYEAANNANKVLSRLRALIENGTITRQEVIDFANAIVQNATLSLNNPIVVCFGVNFYELQARLPSDAPESYSELCDWLETNLMDWLRTNLNCNPRIIESSDNRETLSVRVALWDANLNNLDTFRHPYWEILEVALHTQIYDDFVPADRFKSH